MTDHSKFFGVKHMAICMRCREKHPVSMGLKRCPRCGGHMKNATIDEAYCANLNGQMQKVRRDEKPIELTNRCGR